MSACVLPQLSLTLLPPPPVLHVTAVSPPRSMLGIGMQIQADLPWKLLWGSRRPPAVPPAAAVPCEVDATL